MPGSDRGRITTGESGSTASDTHRQLHLRGSPVDDPGGPCVELLFKPVGRLATSTMSWSGLQVSLRRVTDQGTGVFFLVSTDKAGRHRGHSVVRAGSLAVADAGLDYTEPVITATQPLAWKTLWVAVRELMHLRTPRRPT